MLIRGLWINAILSHKSVGNLPVPCLECGLGSAVPWEVKGGSLLSYTHDQQGSPIPLPLERIPADVFAWSTNVSWALPYARCWGTNRIGPEEQTSRRSLGQQVTLGYRVIFQIQCSWVFFPLKRML